MKILIVLMFALAGCAAMTPGGLTESKSSYDGSEQVMVNPGWSSAGFSGNKIKLGLLKNSKMKREEVFLIVRNDQIKNYQLAGDSFFLKIDGKEYPFSSTEKMDCQIGSQYDVAHCSRAYKTKVEIIEKFLNAKEVKFRLLLQENFVVDGDVDLSDSMTMAYSGFKSFMEKIKSKGMY